MAVAALSGRSKSVWQVGDLRGPILAMARNSSALSLLVGIASKPEHWTYELQEMIHRQRVPTFREGVGAAV